MSIHKTSLDPLEHAITPETRRERILCAWHVIRGRAGIVMRFRNQEHRKGFISQYLQELPEPEPEPAKTDLERAMSLVRNKRVTVSGNIISEPDEPFVENITGWVDTTQWTHPDPDDDEHYLFKVWPDEEIYDGKLWFDIRDCKMIIHVQKNQTNWSWDGQRLIEITFECNE